MEKQIYVPIYLRPFLGLALGVLLVGAAVAILVAAVFAPIGAVFMPYIKVKNLKETYGKT